MYTHIGYLVRSKHVVCKTCQPFKTPESADLVRDNVYPYAQSCHQCGTLLVEPRSDGWPELFALDACRTCKENSQQAG